MASQSYLQSQDTATILDTIDKLRSLGIGDILELPQIIVCGDQSSGKSAVLNAVSTLKFPSKDTLCTRFATEVIMRPGPAEPIVVSIVPGPDRSAAEKRSLEGFRRTDVSIDDIGDLIGQATNLMGIDLLNPRAKRFSNDILRFEVIGPNQPSLTLVDLPGLFVAPSKDQTDEEAESVLQLVMKYMKNKRSVILAVISAKSEFVLQTVTKYSRAVDPHGLRTLGIITKPDKLDVGSDMEKNFMELADNRLSHLHRGWHILVNRDYTTRDSTQDERDQKERKFLSGGVWARLPNNHKGVFSLRARLTELLRYQILEELPSLIDDAENEVCKQREKLDKLGMPRATPADRRRYLIQSSHIFCTLMRFCVNKPYDDKFFGDTATQTGQQKRLRAIVQNTLVQFAKDMRERGHAKHIINETSVGDEESHPHCITKTEFEDEVMEFVKCNRGRELMGTFDPLIIRELFVLQSKPWAALVQEYKRLIWDAAKITIDLVLQSSTDEVTMGRLKRHIIEPSLSELGASLESTVQKLLSTRQNQHPITYNQRLTDSIQKARQAHSDKILKSKIIQAIGTRRETVHTETIDWLLELENTVQLAELERYAASEAIDVMQAYYEVRLRFNIRFHRKANQIEDCKRQHRRQFQQLGSGRLSAVAFTGPSITSKDCRIG